MNLINKDVEWNDATGRRKRGFVTRMISGEYEIIGEDDELHMVAMGLCRDIDEEDLNDDAD